MTTLNVVFIDDEKQICDLYERFFNKIGIQVKTFTDHNSASEYISNNNTDLIFIDYRLHGIDGEKLALKINPHIPKVLVTGELYIEVNYPFECIIEKPAMPETFIKIMDKHLAAKMSNAS